MFGNTFLGEVVIPLNDIDLEKGVKFWHLLQGRRTQEEKTDPPNLGSLRLKIQYTSDFVLSSQYYEPLKKFLLKSPQTKPVSCSPVLIFGDVVGNKIESVQPLVKLFLSTNQVIPLIRSLAEWEISRVTDANIIFRGNTFLSKFLDELMKLIGMHYLHATLSGVIHRVISEKKCCEIDPSRLKDPQCLSQNMANLTGYLEMVIKAVITSVIVCPTLMREVFAVLKEVSMRYFPGQKEISYSVISGFIFLRFFAPAILNPKLFDITHDNIEPVASRTLTLMSKTVQMMGNLVTTRLSSSFTCVVSNTISQKEVFKEDYMCHLQKAFVTDIHVDNMRIVSI